MKFNLKIVHFFSSLLLITLADCAFSAESQSSTLLYISPNDYNYSVHLLHPYFDYWFEQGPIIEPIAFDALKLKGVNISLCKENETAEKIIRIKPSIFYNPQLRVYHAKLVATVFSGDGKVLGSYVGEAQQLGFTSVDNGIQFHLKKVYTLAMQDLTKKMENKPAIDYLKVESKLPCSLVGAQSETKVNFY